jgi:hypothetical protein
VRATPPAPELLAAIPGIAARLAVILANLAALVARAFLRHPVHMVHIVPLWNYINRTARRFTRVCSRLEAGQLRPRALRPARKGGARKPRGFPTTRAWLLAALRHEAAGYGVQIQHLLEQPESAALLAAAPQAARVLRPLCTMLGIVPATLALPPRPKPPPARRVPPRPGTRFTGQLEPSALGPRPPRPLCPRLLHRWPFNQLPLKPA